MVNERWDFVIHFLKVNSIFDADRIENRIKELENYEKSWELLKNDLYQLIHQYKVDEDKEFCVNYNSKETYDAIAEQLEFILHLMKKFEDKE